MAGVDGWLVGPLDELVPGLVGLLAPEGCGVGVAPSEDGEVEGDDEVDAGAGVDDAGVEDGAAADPAGVDAGRW